MATLMGHLSVLALYWLFPGSFSLIGLAVGCLLPDIDGISALIMGFRKFSFPKSFNWKEWKKLSLRIWFLDPPHELHNMLGVIIALPIGVLLTVLLNSLFSRTGEGILFMAGSVLVGGLSHLILDLPAHRSLYYFMVFEKRRGTPFTLFKNMQLFRKIYPFTEVEVEAGYPKYFSLPLFNYLMMSNLFPVAGAALVLLVKAIYPS